MKHPLPEVTLAFDDAQVIPPFSREETDDTDDIADTDDTDQTDDIDDTGWYRQRVSLTSLTGGVLVNYGLILF